MKNLLLIPGLCILLLSFNTDAQNRRQYLTASELRTKLNSVIKAIETDFTKLEGKELTNEISGGKTYQGTFHLIKKDYAIAYRADSPDQHKVYKIRLFTAQTDSTAKAAYASWEQIIKEALPEFFPTPSVTFANGERYKSFYGTGINSVKIEIGQKWLGKECSVWIEISTINVSDREAMEESRYKSGLDYHKIIHGDGIIQRKIHSSLTTEHPKNKYDCFKNSMPLSLQAGDLVYIIYESNEILPMLILRDSVTKKEERIESEIIANDQESINQVRKSIIAEHAGIYELEFTTLTEGEIGKFTVDIFQRPQNATTDWAAKSFCEKLNHIGVNAITNFTFMEKTQLEGLDQIYTPSLALMPNFNTELIGSIKYGYRYGSITPHDSLVVAEKMFKGLQKDIEDCLPLAQKRIAPETELVGGEVDSIKRVEYSASLQSLVQPPTSGDQYRVSLTMFSDYNKSVYWLVIQID
jgi:hypothetical protein